MKIKSKDVPSKISYDFPTIAVIACAIACTLVVSPFWNFDPINVPKLSVLIIGAGILLPFIFNSLKLMYKLIGKYFLSLIITMFVGLNLALFFSPSSLESQLWGTWGRSTGYLAYLSFLIITISSFALGLRNKSSLVFLQFIRLSYVITFYTIVQYGDLDPIPWSQSFPMATLGNINFMSAFLGLTNILLLVKIFFERLQITAKIHYSVVFTVNTVLILASGSIQGLAIVATGLTAIGFHFLRSIRASIALFYLFAVAGSGTLLLGATAGYGPIGKILIQETVTYRIDYWTAGLNIFSNFPFFGAGLDAYGDYYREFRTQIAATRTGPQRVTNTAHNVFIDLLSGGGIIPGLSFLLLISLTIVMLLKKMRSVNFTIQTVALTSLLFGWSAFLMISINQIGVTVWGFVFLGLGLSELVKVDRLRFDTNMNHLGSLQVFNLRKRKTQLLTLLSGLTGLWIGMVPTVTDASYLGALKGKDLVRLEETAFKKTAASYYSEHLISVLLQEGNSEMALDIAIRAVQVNDRNFQAWATIAFSTSPRADSLKARAIEELEVMDPWNEGLQRELRLLREEFQKTSVEK